MMYAYSISAAISIFIGAFFIIKPIRMVSKKIKEEKIENSINEQNEENQTIKNQGEIENPSFKDSVIDESKEKNEVEDTQ